MILNQLNKNNILVAVHAPDDEFLSDVDSEEEGEIETVVEPLDFDTENAGQNSPVWSRSEVNFKTPPTNTNVLATATGDIDIMKMVNDLVEKKLQQAQLAQGNIDGNHGMFKWWLTQVRII